MSRHPRFRIRVRGYQARVLLKEKQKKQQPAVLESSKTMDQSMQETSNNRSNTSNLCPFRAAVSDSPEVQGFRGPEGDTLDNSFIRIDGYYGT